MIHLLTALILTASVPAAHAEGPAPAASAAPAAAPTVGEGSIVRPTFVVGDEKATAGTGFFARIGGATVLVTSHGLLGPNGGLPTLLKPAEVATVTQVVLTDAWTGRGTAKAGPGLVVADAATVVESPSRDLAVFRVNLSGFDTVATPTYTPPAPLALATLAPKVGDIVWLASPVKGSDQRVHAAKVGDVSAAALYVDFVEKIDLVGTSGAPFLNAKGEVVGMCVGGGLMEGVVIGAANPASSIASRTIQALGAK